VLALLKAIGTPGSIGFLGFCSALGLIMRLIGPRSRRIGRAWLLVVYVSYAVGGVPRVAYAVAGGLSAHAVLPLEAVREAGTLIVLGGDNAVGRVRETQRLLEAMPNPLILVSGGPWIYDTLIGSGVPAGRMRFEGRSSNTREQIVHLAPVIRQHSPGVVIVASALQMPRVAALVRAQRLTVLLAPSPIDSEPPKDGWTSFVPRYSGLRLTRDAPSPGA
jgi:uncharacterized SAM-binding protein YcdF (DUF218 family)